MGRNGSGKSSLLWALQGSGQAPRRRGEHRRPDPAALDDAERRTLVGLVPQNAADLLYLETVAEELRDERGRDGRATSTRLVPGIDDDTHPATCPRVNASRSR